jgi:hypothetical protein
LAASYADLTQLDAILRDRPLMQGIQNAYNKATPFLEKVTQSLPLSGRKGIFPVQFGANEGHYARADRGSFGGSSVQKPLLAEIAAAFFYSLFDISGPSISASRDEYAFQEALALSLEQCLTGAKLDRARRMLNASADGVIALVQSKTSTVIVVVDSPLGLLSYKGNVDVKNLLRKTMPIDVIDTVSPPDTKHHDDDAITAVSHSGTGTSITLDTAEATAPADGDYVARAGNYGEENVGIFNALFTAALGGTDTYLNVARAGNLGWQGVTVDAADGGADPVALDPDMLRDTIDTVLEDSGERPGLIVCGYKQRRNIYNLLQPQVRYVPMNLPGGMTEDTLSWDNMPVLVERFFPPQHIGFFSLPFWYHAIDKDFEWIPGEAGTVLHFLLTSDVYRAVGRFYGNGPICLHPAANAILYGLAES